ncbi:hypothetical protein ACIRPK_21790 [Kitasatospora sp. NPDC101801]|uniref:hypothetical protein n=1 Tax=unclassified Kitasatospora TaxID=2633591 RepID=UPI003246DD33
MTLRKHLSLGLLTAAALLGAPTAAQAVDLPAPGGQLQPVDAGAGLGAVTGALGHGVRPAKTLRLDPFAQSSADVLNNGLALEPDNGLRPVSTAPLTAPLSGGGGPQDLLLVGEVTDLLPG